MSWTCRNCHMPATYPDKRCGPCQTRFEAAAHASEPSLFDAPADPMVRSTDRETSRVAAKSVDTNHREREILEALRFLSVASSAYEIQQALNQYGIPRDKNCISRRLTSLVRKGLVSDQGLKPGPYGRDVTAYRLTAAASERGAA